jgi:hypothetical protein
MEANMKSERLGLTVTKEEKELVIRLATIEGFLSQAALIRRLIHKAAEQLGMDDSHPNNSHMEDKSYER